MITTCESTVSNLLGGLVSSSSPSWMPNFGTLGSEIHSKVNNLFSTSSRYCNILPEKEKIWSEAIKEVNKLALCSTWLLSFEERIVVERKVIDLFIEKPLSNNTLEIKKLTKLIHEKKIDYYDGL